MSLLWQFLKELPTDAFELAYLSELTASLEQSKVVVMLKTRYSAISTFLKCRQLYDYVYKQGIRPKRGASLPRMDMGTQVHLGFEKYFKGATVEQAKAEVERSSYALLQKVRAAIQLDPMSVPVDDPAKFLSEYEEVVEQAPAIFERAALALPVSDWEPVLVEHTLEQEIAPGIVLTGTPDLAARYKQDGQLYLLDWKTRGTFQETGAERYNLQFLIYTWMLRKAGYDVKGSYIYEIISEAPKTPKTNKDGTVSRSKCRTTEELLRKAIADSDSLPDDYTDLIAYAKALEWQRLTYDFRDDATIERTMQEVVIPAAQEMAAPHKALRCANRFSCGGCDYASLCYGELEGNDIGYLRSNNFVNSDGSSISLFEEAHL